jgi:hypothetical protein
MAKTGTKKLGMGGTIALIAAVIVTVGVVGQQTHWFNLAAPAGQAITNLNSTTDTLAAKNPDGTMGPQTAYGNWSNSLPAFLKGKLVFAVTDPPQGAKPSDSGTQGQRPTESFKAPSNQAQGSSSGKKGENGPQTVSELHLTITKVEVHIAYQGKQGGPSGTPGQRGKPSVSPEPKEQLVDHWETLTLTTPLTVDLVKLAQTKDVSKLGITELAEGRYTEVRLYVSGATAKLADGSIVALNILGKSNIVRVVQSFTITAGKTTTLVMDFDAQHSVIKAGEIYLLKPVVSRLIETHE